MVSFVIEAMPVWGHAVAVYEGCVVEGNRMAKA